MMKKTFGTIRLLLLFAMVVNCGTIACSSSMSESRKTRQAEIRLYANDGTGRSRVETVAMGGPMPEPAWQPDCRTGFTFGGWYVDEACTSEYDFDRVIDGPLVLYAGYSRDLVLTDEGMVARVTGTSLAGETLPNPNRTDEKYSLGGTDLGIIWEITQGRYGLFFGDSFGPDFKPVPGGGPGGAGDWRSNVLAFSENTDLDEGLKFSGMLTDPRNPGRACEIVPRPGDRVFTSIPTAAICLDGVQYMHYMYWQVGIDDAPENYSSLYCSRDDGRTWTSCRDRIVFDRASNFGMIGYAKRDGWCYMVGTHIGRSSSARLARFRYADILDKKRYEYWNGDRREWVRGDEIAATVILDGTVGELSVVYLEKFGRWLVLYFDAERYAVCYRTAARLNGHWSEERILASGADYPQLYGSYIHPATIHTDRLFYTLSEWSPYNVFLMKAKVDYAVPAGEQPYRMLTSSIKNQQGQPTP